MLGSTTMSVLATAYCLRGTTATGSRVSQGTVAVDPQVIPLGSWLKIPGYGLGQALDTGGMIRGSHIDLWMSSCSEAIRWGARVVQVQLLGRHPR